MKRIKKVVKIKYYIIVFLIEIITLILLALLIYNSLTTPLKQNTFYLSSSDPQTLLDTLNKHGYKTYAIDNLLLKFITMPKKGWYHINETEGRISFFHNLHKKSAPTMQVEIFAGETSLELTKRLANDMKLDHHTLLKAYRAQSVFKEADIIAGRYVVARQADENTTIAYLLTTSTALLKRFSQKYCNKELSPLELKVLLIIASIIQKESNRVEEMPLISSVIYNRLNKHMRLQMDGTLNYGKYAHTIVTPERIKTDTSYFNTYKYKGIPPVPLSTVSIDALKAAYSPKQSNYFFFMLTKNGSHIFSNDYKTHLVNVRAFKKHLKEHNLTIAESNLTDNNTTIITKEANSIIILKEKNLPTPSKPKKLHKIQN